MNPRCSRCRGEIFGPPSHDPKCSVCLLHPGCHCVHVETPNTKPLPKQCIAARCRGAWPVCEKHAMESKGLLERSLQQTVKGFISKTQAENVVAQLFDPSAHPYHHKMAIHAVMSQPSDVYDMKEETVEHKAFEVAKGLRGPALLSDFTATLGADNLDALGRIASRMGFTVSGNRICPTKQTSGLKMLAAGTRAVPVAKLIGNNVTPVQLRELISDGRVLLCDTDKVMLAPKIKKVDGLLETVLALMEH